MAATHNVCGGVVYEVHFPVPGGVDCHILVCKQCGGTVTTGEVTGTPEQCHCKKCDFVAA